MAPLPPDPYAILGVSKDAQTPEIRSSYRKLVLQCHPDKVQDPKLKEQKQNEFQRVQQAYELLTNDAERQKYDDKVRLEDLRRQMKEKAHISSPRPTNKHSGEFEIRTPEMRSSGFKSSPSPSKVYSFSRYEDEYARAGRAFESKSSRSSKRDASFADRHASKREAEKERERERRKDEDRERRKKEEDVIRRKIEKENLKAEKKRQEKIRDREIKRDAEEKHRARYAKASVEVIEDEIPSKSERKRSSRKHDDKGGRTSPREDKPSRPPLSSKSFYSSERSAYDGTLYTSTDRSTFESASFYVAASRGVPPPMARSYSYSGRSTYVPAAPSPPPTAPKAAYVVDETDTEDYVRRSSAPSRRGSGDGPRSSRERSAYRKSSAEVLEDHSPSAPSPAARHAASFSRSPPMGSSPPRYDLPRTNSMPQQPMMSRPSPGITRAQTLGASDLPRGRDRSRNQPQARLDTSESEEEYERERAERKYRSRRTASPEPAHHVQHYEVDPQRRTRRIPQPPVELESPHGHYMYGQPIRVSESRIPPTYRESSHPVPTRAYPANVKTSRFDPVRYSEYPPYNNGAAVRA